MMIRSQSSRLDMEDFESTLGCMGLWCAIGFGSGLGAFGFSVHDDTSLLHLVLK